jgi:glycine/D-amino acid oxidase-like deaminating enzyme
MKVVICGAGVIGAAVAHALVQRGVAPTVVEVATPACAASGKSGGFLALDWCDGGPMAALARRSFELHSQLGREFGDKTGYRTMETLSVVATEARHDLGAYAKVDSPDWLSDHCAIHSQLGNTSNTAQVHPELLTKTLLDEALAGGAKLVTGRVEDIRHDGTRVHGVCVDGVTIDADAVVVAMGPWSTLATKWLPLPPIMGEKGASIVLQPSAPVSAHALFGEFLDAQGGRHGPEVFPRPDGSVYLCGAPDHEELPLDPLSIAPSDAAIATLLTIAGTLSSTLKSATLARAQACYRPIVHDGLPVMGVVPGIAGAFVATAHNCWGILNAPGTGEAMAELIATGSTQHVDLSPFCPSRLM